VKSLEPFRPSFRRRLTLAREFLAKLLLLLRPEAREVRTQRMCPFCGLITPRVNRFCLECGKPLQGLPAERKPVRQG
jgi:predicted amidophosphoribosyltransferase